MKKKWWVLITSITLFLVLIGIVGVKKMTEPTEKEKQIAFLKEHEDDITTYIKRETKSVLKVTYDWNSVNEEIIGNGLPSGAGKVIQVFGYVTVDKEYSFRIDINLDEKGTPNLSTIHYGHAPRIERE